MKRKTSLLSLLLAVIVVLGVLASCTSGKGETTEAGTTAAQENTTAEVTTAEATTEETTAEAIVNPVDYTYSGITITIPGDFTENDQSGIKLLVPPTYPNQADNITLTVGTGDSSAYTEELLRTTIQQLLGEPQDFSFTKDKFGDFDRIVVSYAINLNGVRMTQETVYIFGDGKVYNVTFTSVSDDFKRTFSAVRDSIRISTESAETEPIAAEPVEYSYSGITLTVPGNFSEVDQSGIKILVPPTYPNQADNISLSVGPGSVSDYTEASLRATLQQVLGELQDFTFAKDKQDGLDRVIISYTANVNGIAMKQESVDLFSAGKVYSVTFTTLSDDFKDVFETAKNSIKITG